MSNELDFNDELDGQDESMPDVQHVIEPAEPGKVTTIMTIGDEDHSPQVMHTASIQMGTFETDTNNLVRVRFKYPSKWNKPKFFKDGDEKAVGKETADQFVSQGIATIITEAK